MDVSITGSLEVLRRIPASDVRMPLTRPLNLKLQTLASPLHDFEQLNNAASSTVFHREGGNCSNSSHPPLLPSGPTEASITNTKAVTNNDDNAGAVFVVGASVLVRGKKKVSNQGSTKGLMYHRGTEA